VRKAVFLVVLLAGIGSAAWAEETPWKRKIGVGADSANGNTKNTQGNLSLSAGKGWSHSEFLSKFNLSYSETSGAMDGQKWAATARYQLLFGEDDRWFNPYQVVVDHDKLADVYVRYLPSVGIGYWLAKSDKCKWSIEDSIGYEVTDYYGKTTAKTTAMIVRTFLDKLVFEKAHLTEDLSVIPSLEGSGYRIKSETGFSNPLTKELALTLRYMIDFDSEPADNKKKTDTRFIAGLDYSF